MMSDSLFTDAGWFFFAIWSLAVATVSIAAFGHDLLPSKTPSTASSRSSSTPRMHADGSGKL